MFQLSKSTADETNLWQAISNLQEAMDKKENDAINVQMLVDDDAFRKISLVS